MPTQRESVCCHEMNQLKCLLEDPRLLKFMHPVLHNMQTLLMCVCAKPCLVFLCMHIYIATKVLKYLIMKTGV